MNSKTIFKIFIGPFVIVLLHILGTVMGWYESFWWMDIPAHFFGGLTIVWSFHIVLNYFKSQGQYSVSWKPLQIFILLGIVGLAAASWELMEFALDNFLHTTTQLSVLDTIKDMAMGISGGGLAAIITTFSSKNSLK